MADKVRMILKAIDSEKETFIVSDADVSFYDLSISELLTSRATVTYALDCPLTDTEQPSYCAGFATIQPGPLSRELYTIVLDNLEKNSREQAVLTGIAIPHMIARYPNDFRVDFLPPDRYWNKTHPRSNRKLAVHHANWIIGVSAKLAELKRIRDLEQAAARF